MTDLLPFIYHERQEQGSMLCAQHSLNNLLQTSTFSAQDLAGIAQQLDQLEREQLENTADWSSSNYDDSGFFSLHVIEEALAVYGLSLVRWKKDLSPMHQSPESMHAFILNHMQHWYTIRRFGDSPDRFYNLDSCTDSPQWISPLFLGLTMREAELQGYSIFAVVPSHENGLPACEADDVAQTLPSPQNQRTNGNSRSTAATQTRKRRQSLSDDDGRESGSDVSDKRRRMNGSTEHLSEEDQMALAIADSLKASKLDEDQPAAGSSKSGASVNGASNASSNNETAKATDDPVEPPGDDDNPTLEQLRQRRLARFGG